MRLVVSFTPTAAGPLPTPMVWTVLVGSSITDSESARKSATYVRFVSELTATPLGPSPTGTVAITCGAAGTPGPARAREDPAMSAATHRIATGKARRTPATITGGAPAWIDQC